MDIDKLYEMVVIDYSFFSYTRVDGLSEFGLLGEPN